MTTASDPPSCPPWQREKHLQSGDRFWLLTDIQRYTEKFYPWSEPQELFRVGIYHLKTGCFGFAHFGRDIAFALLKAGLGLPPWTCPAPVVVELHREPHEHDEKGRYMVSAQLLPLDPEVAVLERKAKHRFRRATFTPDAVPGMWDDLADRAKRENAIEAAVESMRDHGEFSAGDIKKIVGKDPAITAVLKDLVVRGILLPPTGKKRGTKYLHAPPPGCATRVDWTG